LGCFTGFRTEGTRGGAKVRAAKGVGECQHDGGWGVGELSGGLWSDGDFWMTSQQEHTKGKNLLIKNNIMI
jgi:hypothetical protein